MGHLSLRCPECSGRIRVATEALGANVTCPSCQATVEAVPGKHVTRPAKKIPHPQQQTDAAPSAPSAHTSRVAGGGMARQQIEEARIRSEFEARIRSLQERNDHLEHELGHVLGVKSTLVSGVESLEARKEQLSDETSTRQLELGDLEAQIADRNSALGQLREQYSEAVRLRKKLPKMRSEAEELETAVSSQSARKEELARLDMEIQERKRAVNAKQRELRRREKHCEEVEEAERGLAAREARVEQRRVRVLQRERQCTANEEELDEIRRTLGPRMGALTRKERTVQAKVNALAKREKRFQAKEEAFAQLKEDAAGLRKRVRALEKDAIKAERTAAKHIETTKEMTAERDELLSQIDSLEHELDESQERVDELLVGQVKQDTSAADALRRTVEEQQARIRELEEQLAEFNEEGNEPNVPTTVVDFDLLPPGSWDIDDVIQHYRQIADSLPSDLEGRAIEWTRLTAIQRLKPTKCYVGKRMWLGYVVFTFSRTSNVVLECPIEGNATYVIYGDWKTMARHTKQFLRSSYPGLYRKCVHKRGWFERVKEALGTCGAATAGARPTRSRAEDVGLKISAGSCRQWRTVSDRRCQTAISEVLQTRPNSSCVRRVLPTLVLRHLQIVTRGRPRDEFCEFVDVVAQTMAQQDKIQFYKAKNQRVRLL
jgi:hypothetical protein